MQAVSKNLICNFIEILNQMRENEDIYDILLCVNGSEIRGNRLLLSIIGTTFREMFETNPIQTRFTLKNVDTEAVAMIVECSFKFSYQPCSITEANIYNLIQTGVHLGCIGILEECCRHIERHTKCSSCMKYQHILWQVIKNTNCLTSCDLSLIGVVLKYVTFFIAKHFAGVCISEGFRMADADEILSLVALDDLNVDSEDVVLAAVRAWYLADPVNRRGNYPSLLKYIRWPLLSRACLEAASNEDDIWACCEVQDLIRKSFLYQLRDPASRSGINFGHGSYLTLRRGMLLNKP